MKLWVLRHGEAEPRAKTDAERRLTAHGREQVLHSAAYLIGQPLQAIVASPYVRPSRPPRWCMTPWASPNRCAPCPEGDVQQVIGEIERLGLEHMLLVSHQPLVGTLVGALEHGDRQQPAAMSTASLAELEGEWPLAGLMTLRAIHSPA